MASSLAFLLVAVISCAAFAGDDPYEFQAWKGEITIQYSLTGNFKSIPTNNPNRTEESMYTESKEGKVIIGACVNGGVYKWIESNDFLYSRTDKISWKNDHLVCEEGPNGRTARPGSSGFAKQTSTGYLDMGAEPRATVMLTVQPNGIYSLMATGGRPYLWTQNTTESTTNPCTRKTKTVKTFLSPDIKKRSQAVSSSGDTTVIQGPTHPVTLPLMVNYRGTYSGKVIEDKTVIIDKNEPAVRHLLYGKGKEGEGVWRENMVASWHFHVVDPCEAVMEQLRQSMAFLTAYSNVVLTNSGLDGKAYNRAIGVLAGRIYAQTIAAEKGGGKAAGQYQAGTDLGVRIDNCRLVGKERYEDSQKKACYPDIIFDAVIAHEMTHVNQCESDWESFKRGLLHDPTIQSKNEIEAYCTEIGMLFEWLDQNCSAEDLSERKKTVGNLCN